MERGRRWKGRKTEEKGEGNNIRLLRIGKGKGRETEGKGRGTEGKGREIEGKGRGTEGKGRGAR